MRVINDKEMRALRKKKGVASVDGKPLKLTKLFNKKAKAEVSSEEKQAKALEIIAKAMLLSLEADKGQSVLLEMIKKIRDIKIEMPEMPKEWEEIEAIPSRDDKGYINKIRFTKIWKQKSQKDLKFGEIE